MRILHYIYDDIKNPWLGGGGAIRNMEVNKRLSKKHNITIVCGGYLGAKNEEKKEGVNIKRIGNSKSYLWSRLLYTFKAHTEIKKEDYDLIVDDISLYSPTFAPFFTKKPVIGSVRSWPSTNALKKYHLFGLIPFTLEKLIFGFYNNIITVSPHIQKKLNKKFPKTNTIFLPNGFDLPIDKKNKEENYVLFLGRIDVFGKGLDFLVNVFKDLGGKAPNLKLVIAGDGRDVSRLQEIIGNSKNIEYVGKKTGREKEALLRNCLFVVHPSRFEAWPMVVMEAGSHKKPVLGFDISGMNDTIKNNKTGFLVPFEDSQAFTDKLLLLHKNKELRKKLGAGAFTIVKKYGWKKLIKKREDFYYRVVSK